MAVEATTLARDSDADLAFGGDSVSADVGRRPVCLTRLQLSSGGYATGAMHMSNDEADGGQTAMLPQPLAPSAPTAR